MTKLWKKGQKDHIRFIVMHHSVPVMEVNPIDEDELLVQRFGKDIEEALQQVKDGKTYSSEEVKAMLGL